MYDLELLDMVNQRKDIDPYIYESFMALIKSIAEKRNDESLMRVYNHFAKNDKTDEEIKAEIKENTQYKDTVIDEITKRKANARRTLTDDEKKDMRNLVNISLFGLMTKVYDSKNDNKQGFEQLKAEVLEFIGNELSFNDEEVKKMTDEIISSENNNDLGTTLAKKIAEISTERGISEKYLDINSIKTRAKRKTQPRGYKNIKNEINGNDLKESKMYASMFLDEDDRKRVFSFVDNCEKGNIDDSFNLTILEKIKGIDTDFYYSMLRNLGIAANKSNNLGLKNKFNELVEHAVHNQLDGTSTDLEKAQARAKVVFDERLYNRYEMFQSDLIQGSPDGIYDVELIEMVRQRNTQIYSVLMSNMDRNSINRDDQNLRKVYESFLKKDEQEKQQSEVESEIKNTHKIDTELESTIGNNGIEIVNISIEDIAKFADPNSLIKGNKTQNQDDGIGLE